MQGRADAPTPTWNSAQPRRDVSDDDRPMDAARRGTRGAGRRDRARTPVRHARRQRLVRVLPFASGDGPARPRVRRRRRLRAAAADALASKRWPSRRSRASSRSPSSCARWAARCATSSRRSTPPEGIWVRAFKSRLHNTLPPAVANDLPDWLWERLGNAYGDATRAALALSWQSPAPFDLRINPLLTTREAALAQLAQDGLDAAATPYSPLGIRVGGRPSLARHPWLVDGRLEVQDECSQLIGYAVAPRRSDMVVDFCAGRRRQDAPARRADALAGPPVRIRRRGQPPRQVHAETRALRAFERASAGARQRARHQGQAPGGKIDRVLVDAPCTGFGTLRRNPDLKWRQPESAVAELAAKQASILAAAATLVKPGGRLVYATMQRAA